MNSQRHSSWDAAGLDLLLKALGPYLPEVEVESYNKRLKAFSGLAGPLKRILLFKCKHFGLDPDDPFHPHPRQDSLGTEGIVVGKVLPGERDFRFSDFVNGSLFLGAPRSGKTNSIINYIEQVQNLGIGVFIPDLRGDYLGLSRLPGALLIPASMDKFNPFQAPPGVDQRKWINLVIARLTLDFGLQYASQSFAIGVANKLNEDFLRKGAIPTILDFYEVLQRQKPRPRSADESYLERVLPRIRTLILMAGESVFDVQKGFPVIEEVEAGRLVILDLRVDKLVADFFCATRLYYLYWKRMESQDPFHQRTVLTVLDEQRSLIRSQSHEFGIPDIELLFSRSRALGFGFLIAEQIPSAVSPAVLTSSRLRLGFNTTAPESWYVEKLLGLAPNQFGELQKLPVGQCIARMAGDRIPGPFRLKIPLSGYIR